MTSIAELRQDLRNNVVSMLSDCFKEILHVEHRIELKRDLCRGKMSS